MSAPGSEPAPGAGLQQLGHHAHACLVCDGAEEAARAAAPFVAAGLRRGDRCIYVYAERPPQALVAALWGLGTDVDAATARGALQLRCARDTCPPGDRARPDEMIAVVARGIDEALADGFEGVRLVREARWGDHARADGEIAAYETRVEALYAERPIAVLCVYDRGTLPGEIVRRGVLGHPLVADRRGLVRNVLYATREGHVGTPAEKLDLLLGALHREHTEQALRESEAQLRRVMEGSQEGFWDVDLRTGEVRCSARSAELIGRTLDTAPPDLAGWHALVHPEDAPAVAAIWEDLLAGRSRRYEVELRSALPDGRWRWILVRGKVVTWDADGHPTRAWGVHTDLTERRAAQEALDAARAEREALEARMRQADRMRTVGTLAAGVAHEINNPLAFVLANVHHALCELEQGGADPSVVEALRDAREGALRVRDIVRDLTRFARDESPGAASADVHDAVRAAVNLAGSVLRRRARLVLDLAPVPPVAGGAHRLVQVLVNLLENAAQAIPEGAAERNEIRVTCGPAAGGRVRLSVSDTGAGIPPEDLDHVFDPFFTTRPVGSGTGLGLSICHGIVRALGGTITVESRLGAGTRFHVELPAALPPDSADPAGAGAAPPAEAAGAAIAARVLVVDDDPQVGAAVRRILGTGCKVFPFTSAHAALDRARAERFDVVLCDVMLAETSGVDLYAALRRDDPAWEARFAFIHGGALTPRAAEVVAAHRDRAVERPFEADDLRRVVAGRLAAAGALRGDDQPPH